MPLTVNEHAYNAVTEALNQAEDRMAEASEDRIRAWDACEALFALGNHGRRQTPRHAAPAPRLKSDSGTWKKVQ